MGLLRRKKHTLHVDSDANIVRRAFRWVAAPLSFSAGVVCLTSAPTHRRSTWHGRTCGITGDFLQTSSTRNFPVPPPMQLCCGALRWAVRGALHGMRRAKPGLSGASRRLSTTVGPNPRPGSPTHTLLHVAVLCSFTISDTAEVESMQVELGYELVRVR